MLIHLLIIKLLVPEAKLKPQHGKSRNQSQIHIGFLTSKQDDLKSGHMGEKSPGLGGWKPTLGLTGTPSRVVFRVHLSQEGALDFTISPLFSFRHSGEPALIYLSEFLFDLLLSCQSPHKNQNSLRLGASSVQLITVSTACSTGARTQRSLD